MLDLPRQKLCELIRRYGTSLCDEPLRAEGLLRDVCPANRREVNVLVSALKERIPAELLNLSVSVPVELSIARLSKRLQDNQGMAGEMARWAVESWALALGKINPHALEPVSQPQKESAAPPRRKSVTPPPLPSSQPIEWSIPAIPPGPPSRRSGPRIAIGLLIVAIFVLIAVLATVLIQNSNRETNASPAAPTQTPAAPVSTPTSYPSVASFSPIASPAATPYEGQLSIDTQPIGATVTIDGLTTRTAPVTVSNLSPGLHRLRVTLDGYEPQERSIEVKSGQVAMTGTITLSPRNDQFDGVWVAHDSKGGWNATMTIANQSAAITMKVTDRLSPKSDHWNGLPAPYNRSRTLSFEWSAESESVRITATSVGIQWNEWRWQREPSGLPLSSLRSVVGHPSNGGFNNAYPPSRDWGFTVQGSNLVSGGWTFRRSR